MADEAKSQGWWQTVPGILTATAGIGPPAGVSTGASSSAPPPTGPAAPYPRALAAGTEVRVGGAVYRILAAQVDRRNTETLTLRFTVRMTNNERFPTNFWDESFRLRVDGVPTAPAGNLNKVVPAQSAEEGVVEFVIPVTTQAVVLQVKQGAESTEIAVDLSGKPRG